MRLGALSSYTISLRLDPLSNPPSSLCPSAPKSDHPGIENSVCDPGTAPERGTSRGEVGSDRRRVKLAFLTSILQLRGPKRSR